jgi:hypothetical protein
LTSNLLSWVSHDKIFVIFLPHARRPSRKHRKTFPSQSATTFIQSSVKFSGWRCDFNGTISILRSSVRNGAEFVLGFLRTGSSSPSTGTWPKCNSNMLILFHALLYTQISHSTTKPSGFNISDIAKQAPLNEHQSTVQLVCAWYRQAWYRQGPSGPAGFPAFA